MFPAIVQPHDRAHLALRLVGGSCAHGAACAAFLVGKVDLEPVGVLIADPRLGECLGGPGAKPRHVPGEHVVSCFAFDDPLCRQQPHTPRLGKAGDDAVATEVTCQFGHRTEQHVGVRRPDHRAVDHPFDPGGAHDGHTIDGAHHVVLDPFQIVSEQLVAKTLRRAVLGPEAEVLLVSAHQQPLAFLAQVIFSVAIGHRGQAAVQRRNFGNGFGHEILVFGRLQRQCDARHRRHLAPPEAGGIHHPRCCNIALFGAYHPGAIRLLFGSRHRAKADDLGPCRARARSICVGDARRVHIAPIGFPHDAADAVEIDQRVQAFGLGPVHLEKIHVIEFGLGGLKAQLVFARLGLGQIERSGLKHAAALPGFLLQFLVQPHRVVLDAADVGAVVQPVDVGRRVPGRTRGQLVTFQQNDVAPAQFGQMVKDRTTDDAATDDDGLCVGAHVFFRPCVYVLTCKLRAKGPRR